MKEEQLPVSPSDVRSKYARVFEQIGVICAIFYDQKPGLKYENVVAATKQLESDGFLNEYLLTNLKTLYDLYPTMLPGKVAQNYKEDAQKEEERLIKMNELLILMIKDLSYYIEDLAQELADRERRRIANSN